MKVTKPYIVATILIAMFIITVNAVIRVRYFGRVEQQYWESKDAGGADAALDGTR